MHSLHDSADNAQLTKVSQLLSQASWQTHHSILDHWHNLHTEGEFIVVGVASDVMGNKLL